MDVSCRKRGVPEGEEREVEAEREVRAGRQCKAEPKTLMTVDTG